MNMQTGQLVESGMLPPFVPNPKNDFLFNNHWYPMPKELRGIVVSSPDELVRVLNGKELGYHGEIFIGGFHFGTMMKQGITIKATGYMPWHATLQYNGEH